MMTNLLRTYGHGGNHYYEKPEWRMRYTVHCGYDGPTFKFMIWSAGYEYFHLP